MARDISEWLENLGLGKYAEVFAENEIDLAALPHVTEEDLKEIGVALGTRRKLLAAIAALGEVGAAAAAVPEPLPLGAPEAERRQLTVLFADLVGSTALAEQLDPEDMRDVITAYQNTVAGEVTRYAGHVAKYMGDGVLAYFGWPRAHEDDAERAVRAGLAVIQALAGRKTPEGQAVEARIGIATGLVVVGDLVGEGAAQEEAVVGETPNLAARLQSLAEPNTVVIAPATHHLVSGLFEHKDLGSHDFKGISTPVRAWRVVGETTAESRFDAAHAAGMTPLVGREEEINLLLKRWEQAKDGEGQVVLLSGEPGVGKSRILRGFRDRLEAEPHSRALYYCSPYHQNSAFHPVIDQLERALRFQKDDEPAAKLDKLDTVLTDLELTKADLEFLLATLLSLPAGDRYPDLALGPEQMKERTMAALIQIIAAMARLQPVLMVVEDAHWLDPTTQEFLSLAVDEIASSRVLLFVTHRPEFESPWHAESHVTALALNRLSRKDSAAMIGELTGGKDLPEEVLEQMLAKTDGVPLFVEELTKAVLESGLLEDAGDHYALSGPLPPLAIPASLQDSLMARLDRLAPVKEVAQLAAMLGRVFSRDLLGAVSPLDQGALEAALSRLVEAGLIYRHGFGAGESYEFKHALVQDTAYQSLLKSTRQRYHRRIAEVLAERFPQTAETQPELVAHHFTEAGLSNEAISYWQRAGQRAAERSANVEAIAHLRKGLELLRTLQASPERDERELDLCVLLGPVLMAIKGFAAPEVAEVYSRSEELLQEVGKTKHAFPVTWGLWFVKQHSGQIDAACQLADKLLPLAERQADKSLLLQAHHAAWTSRFTREELHSVRRHTEQGIALYNMDEHRSHALLYGGHDPGMCCRIIGGLTMLLLGFPEQGRRLIMDGVKLAEDLGHALSLALALSFSGTVYLYLREPSAVRDRVEALSTLCSKHGFGHFGPMAKMLRGWAEVEKSGSTDGIEMMRDGLDAFRATGAKRLSFQLAILTDAFGRTGQFEKAPETLSEALDVIESTGERRWEPEVYRLKGEMLCSGAISTRH